MLQCFLLTPDHFKVHNRTMNVKRCFLLPGALALALAYAAPLLPVVAQTPTAPAGQYSKRGINLNLTADQKAQLKQIRESTRSQIDAVLTQEQREQLAAAKQQRQQGQQGQKTRGMWASLNLTADQKAKVKAIRQDAKQKMDAVLTAEQRQQLEQQRQTRQQNRQRPGQ
jgi:periplasmic protein CpxP/Spy